MSIRKELGEAVEEEGSRSSLTVRETHTGLSSLVSEYRWGPGTRGAKFSVVVAQPWKGFNSCGLGKAVGETVISDWHSLESYDERNHMQRLLKSISSVKRCHEGCLWGMWKQPKEGRVISRFLPAEWMSEDTGFKGTTGTLLYPKAKLRMVLTWGCQRFWTF